MSFTNYVNCAPRLKYLLETSSNKLNHNLGCLRERKVIDEKDVKEGGERK
jgi:hypothetical protein